MTIYLQEILHGFFSEVMVQSPEKNCSDLITIAYSIESNFCKETFVFEGCYSYDAAEVNSSSCFFFICTHNLLQIFYIFEKSKPIKVKSTAWLKKLLERSCKYSPTVWKAAIFCIYFAYSCRSIQSSGYLYIYICIYMCNGAPRSALNAFSHSLNHLLMPAK